MGMSDAEKLARAVLLFYHAGPWDADLHQSWRELTGSDAVTTRVLGDLARAVIPKDEAR
jgi:hypothetical protein